MSSEHTVRAAGGVLWRRKSKKAIEVLLVHRPRYDDWSFPKGKCDEGETFAETARREVEEETGLTVSFGAELPVVRYRDQKGRPKVVHYWAMAVNGGSFVANDEVDEVRWLRLGDAEALLSYRHDVELLGSLSAVI